MVRSDAVGDTTLKMIQYKSTEAVWSRMWSIGILERGTGKQALTTIYGTPYLVGRVRGLSEVKLDIFCRECGHIESKGGDLP